MDALQVKPQVKGLLVHEAQGSSALRRVERFQVGAEGAKTPGKVLVAPLGMVEIGNHRGAFRHQPGDGQGDAAAQVERADVGP